MSSAAATCRSWGVLSEMRGLTGSRAPTLRRGVPSPAGMLLLAGRSCSHVAMSSPSPQDGWGAPPPPWQPPPTPYDDGRVPGTVMAAAIISGVGSALTLLLLVLVG